MSHILGTPVLGSDTGQTSPLAGWKANGTNKRAVQSLDFAHKECASAGLLLRQGEDSRLRTAPVVVWFLITAHCVPQLEPDMT